LEKVYENALAHRLRRLGMDVKQQHPLKVYDEDGTLIGDYNADLFVDNRLIIELKAAKALADSRQLPGIAFSEECNGVNVES